MTTPEERAKEAVRDWHLMPHQGSFNADLVALLTHAIRQAENSKLEEAARLMDRVLADSKAALIRTLKHKD